MVLERYSVDPKLNSRQRQLLLVIKHTLLFIDYSSLEQLPHLKFRLNSINLIPFIKLIPLSRGPNGEGLQPRHREVSRRTAQPSRHVHLSTLDADAS